MHAPAAWPAREREERLKVDGGVFHKIQVWRGRVEASSRAARAGEGGVLISCFMQDRSPMTIAIRPSHLCNAGTEHVGFSPTRQTLRAPSAKRREVFGESHEG